MISIMHNNCLNHLTLLYVFLEKIIKIDIRKTATKKDFKKKSNLVYYRFHKIRIDTGIDSG